MSRSHVPVAEWTKKGSPPTLRHDRTGEFTPPGKSSDAFLKAFDERVVLRDEDGFDWVSWATVFESEKGDKVMMSDAGFRTVAIIETKIVKFALLYGEKPPFYGFS